MESGYRRQLRVYSISHGKFTLCLILFLNLGTDHPSSMISYPNYKFYWPIRALGLYSKTFGDAELV